MPQTEVTTSIFERIGGAVTVDRLVESFYRNMDTLPEARTIRAMHAPDLGATKGVLKRYLCEWLGGPRLYSAEKGHPRLRQRHLGFRIASAERDAWMLCMSRALAAEIADAEARAAIGTGLRNLADWMRNTADMADDAGPAHD
ncbi:group II truncated hemoglobin [Aquabacter spiritensis]|uniref:Hemoglobin n=1 Tax=Aquabacter spiritensis TaxID=933073 RepID=A0A4V6NZM2_9HYPH|nr:group II truncated hemoglobin [Aquabacter spiritensis]TCT07878.1 hemoglobin [Aquabacter spiritensis]